MEYKIGDIVEDVKWGKCEILTDGGTIQGGRIAYVAKPLDDENKKYGKLCLLEKDLTPIKYLSYD